MNWGIYLRGVVIGLSIAAPLGPIGVLVIRRTLAEGRPTGILSGLGAATADAIYAGIAGFGLTFISAFLIEQQVWLRLGGGLFLCYLGIRAYRSTPTGGARAAPARSLTGAYASTLFLTLTNPMTILSFAAIFAALGVAAGADYRAAAVLVAGVFTGTTLWMSFLSTLASLAHGRLRPQRLRWVNRAAGIVIAAFGVVALLSIAVLRR